MPVGDLLVFGHDTSGPCWNHVGAECLYVPFADVLSSDCAEAIDLATACEAGYYPEPPKPVTPVVPAAGYQGAVTDPDAVDKVIADTKKKQDASNLAFFRSLQEAPTDTQSSTDLTLILLAAAIAAVFLLRR